MKDWLSRNWKQYLIWALIYAMGVLSAKLGWDVPLPPVPVPLDNNVGPDDPRNGWRPPLVVGGQEEQPPPTANFGWVHDDDAVKAVQDGLKFKVFADTPAGQAQEALPDAVYLWQSYRKLFNKGPPSKNQLSIGSCVSFGTSTAIERTLATQIVIDKGNSSAFRTLSPEVIYGGSRVQIGKGRLGRGDGSVGAWAAEFVKAGQWGVVTQEVNGGVDLTTYTVERCRTYGNSGVPAGLLDIAKKRPVKNVTMVKTWDEAKKSLASGYAIAVCSNVGFNGKRNAQGVKVASGSWGHCMCIDGYQVDGGKEYGHIENSWGARPDEGPVGWGEPPDSGFWTSSATISRMLAQNDSWAFASVDGFVARKIDWFAMAPLKNEIRFANLRAEVQYATLP